MAPEAQNAIKSDAGATPVHGLMSHVQLDTIKKLAERDAHARVQDEVVIR
jgi:hypothetical protein